MKKIPMILLLKLWNIPLVRMIQLVTLVTSLAGGECIRDEVVSLVLIALLPPELTAAHKVP